MTRLAETLRASQSQQSLVFEAMLPLRLPGTQKSRYGRVQARGTSIPGAGETRSTVAEIVFDTT
jgi:hypothetical protein